MNVRLHRLLHLSDLVLDHAALEYRARHVQVHGFVLSMAWLLETLGARLRTERGADVNAGRRRAFGLDARHRLTIRARP